MSHFLRMSVLGAIVLMSVGCGGSTPVNDPNEASKQLQNDPDYAKQMEGKMGGTPPPAAK